VARLERLFIAFAGLQSGVPLFALAARVGNAAGDAGDEKRQNKV
jgi:hypothetical protein